MDFRWWEIINGNHTYFIIITQAYLARLKPSADEINKVAANLQQGRLPNEGLYKIPMGYVTKIVIDESEPAIKIAFNQESEEIYPIASTQQRFEIFDYLNNNTSHLGYDLVKQSGLARAKQPIIAILIMSAIFGYAYYLADLQESGTYMGRQMAIALALADLGTQTLSFIYLGIMGIAFIALFRKLLQPKVEHVLQYR